MVKKAVRRGRSERRGESYAVRYVEPLSDARTKLAVFFNILLGRTSRGRVSSVGSQPQRKMNAQSSKQQAALIPQ